MDLIIKNGKVTSLDILEQINFFRGQEGRSELEHKTLMRTIKDEFEEEINEHKIVPVEYKDKKGENRPMFELTISQAKQILVRESKLVRKAIIKKLEELENSFTKQYSYMIDDPIARAKAWIVEQEERKNLVLQVEAKEQIIQELKPRVEYLDTILSSQDTLTVSQIAADYGISAIRLNQILHDKKIQRKVNGQWLLYASQMNRGYTKSETLTIKKKDGTKKVVVNTKWTQKGRLKIHEMLTKLGVVALMDIKEIKDDVR